MAVTTDSPSARARAAARTLATLGRGAKDAALEQIALAIERDSAAIVEANAEDLAAARASGQSSALLDRLTLDSERVLALCDAVRAVAALDDPVGQVVTGWRLPNGLDVQKVRVPLGVLLVVYEARPNVTVDVASLCLKSGNACLLRGSTSARATNAALLRCVRHGLKAAGLPEDAVVPLEASREELASIVADPSACDVVIPRGGEALKKFLLEHARVPVLVAAGGNCHVYLHSDADPAKALPIVINAKTQRPGVCNAC
jgi:glutamate-5-semialdehyde dehydrogenase